MTTGTGDSLQSSGRSSGPSGRRRKYYRITPDGRAQLVEQHRQWKTVEETMRSLWSNLETKISANHSAQAEPLPQEG